MRVTNARLSPACRLSRQGFNPLYAGHKRRDVCIICQSILCFNPLYAGHKPMPTMQSVAARASFNPLYAGHKLYAFTVVLAPLIVSIPYMRVTNSQPESKVLYSFWVSIPYMRVTNPGHRARRVPKVSFQSPICGSQTTRDSKIIRHFIKFQSPICGSQTAMFWRKKIFSFPVSIPYMRVTNAHRAGIRKLWPAFQSPICGSQTPGLLLGAGLDPRFNPLYAGHKPSVGRWQWP